MDVVILTPTGPERSSFVRDVVVRLSSKAIKPKGIPRNVGPFRIIWESRQEEEKTLIMKKFGCSTSDLGLRELRQVCSSEPGALGDLLEWAEKKYRVRGKVQFSRADLAAAVERVLHSRRAFLPTVRPGCIRAMTINQAKNREFESVIVLWPFALGAARESQRRRLYSALTRAK